MRSQAHVPGAPASPRAPRALHGLRAPQSLKSQPRRRDVEFVIKINETFMGTSGVSITDIKPPVCLSIFRKSRGHAGGAWEGEGNYFSTSARRRPNIYIRTWGFQGEKRSLGVVPRPRRGVQVSDYEIILARD
ncbi:hypothetical protein EVAR_18189_1 [Eumeta japonica]|uniref:Uncharacterized protein n=1 Tax=Eumeta variegata TaxID=151549 RepID=A0A4C1UVX8_EUMVA|nr:hypothetical protein EVAR_18189_1 [Eumeta japonica]